MSSAVVDRASDVAAPGAASLRRGASYELRLVHLREGARLQTLRARELTSLMAPWQDAQSKRPVWVLGLTAELEAQLAADGLEIREFRPPPELPRWPADMQRAFSAVAERCQDAPGGLPKPTALQRWSTPTPPGTEPLDAFNSRYGPYYLPYEATPGVPAFRDRVSLWRDGATSTGYDGLRLPAELFGGWPLRPGATRYRVGTTGDGPEDLLSGTDLVYVDFGWRAGGTFSGRRHAGPKAVLFLNANQHARELSTHEVAWRLLQRIVYAYATGESLGEWDRPAGFWREQIDAGLHVVVIPSANPWGYHEVVKDDGDWARLPGDSNSWRRTNRRGVDINRNFPVGWFQPGNDGTSPWGSVGSKTGTWAGREPESERETRAIEGVLMSALGDLGLDLAHADRRVPVVAVDVHSSLGAVMTPPAVTWEHNRAEGDAYACGPSSACTHPDRPFFDATFGRDARPTVVGNTGLLFPSPGVDDPPLPYVHGHGTQLLGPNNGTLRIAFGAPMWPLAANTYRGLTGATLEVTAQATNPFAFGTCADVADATLAVDTLVLDLAPAVARMAESALSPAVSTPAASRAVDAAGRPVPMPELADDIENLGVVTEAAATEGRWEVSMTCGPSPLHFCVELKDGVPPCDPGSSDDRCTGTWWTAYTPGDYPEENRPRSLRTGWQFAVRRADPDAADVIEHGARRHVRLRVAACEPVERCQNAEGAPLAATRLRGGTHYDLYTLSLGATEPPPTRVVMAREVLFLGTWTETSRSTFAARQMPIASALPLSPEVPDMQASGVELASLVRPGELVTNVRLTQTARPNQRSEIRLHAAWRRGKDWTVRRLLHGEIDYNAAADASLPGPEWAGYPPSDQYLTYDFDLIRPVMDRSGGGSSTSGADVWVGWGGTEDVAPPTITAKVLANPCFGDANCCPLTAVGTGRGVLDAARLIRAGALLPDADGRVLVQQYQR
ncbi:MAG: hypothetical protein IT374_16775, partial [Polyangiaceae bacterium]|nr:hypothetical protein [Polyangiaceae bacterium]